MIFPDEKFTILIVSVVTSHTHTMIVMTSMTMMVTLIE